MRLANAVRLTLLLALAAPAAHAQSASDVRGAAQAFDAARTAFRDESFMEAAEHFEAADALVPSAKALGLAIQARSRAGQLGRAATLAELALQRHPDQEELVRLAAPLIEQAGREFHRLTLVCSEACEVIVGTRLVHGGARASHVVYLAPGEQVVQASWDEGRKTEHRVDAAASERSTIEFAAPAKPKRLPPVQIATPALQRAATKNPAPPKRSSGLPPYAFWSSLGLTAVVGGITAYSAYDMYKSPGVDAVRERCVGLGADCAEYQAGLDAQKRTNLLMAATGGLGVITAVLGVFLTDWDGEDAPKKPQVGLKLSPYFGVNDGATLGAQGTFQ